LFNSEFFALLVCHCDEKKCLFLTDILVIQCVVGYFTCEKTRADNMGKQNYNYQRDGCGSEW